MVADFKALGVIVTPQAGTEEQEAFQVWRCNWKSLIAFLTLETQWRVAGTPAGLVWLGLDYTAARAILGKRFRKRLADLRIMEGEALPILNAGDDT